MLGDGRKIQPAHFPSEENSIALHPEFRIIMLANRFVLWSYVLLSFLFNLLYLLFRPGFPFLGNDLFGVLGDLFSVHTVDNPSRESEMTMLRKYGPSKCLKQFRIF